MPATQERRRAAKVLPSDAGRQREHRLEEADPWIADGELCGVDADSEAASSRRTIVARERRLAALVEATACVEGQRVCGDDEPLEQTFP
jgi:hypothetical protein